MHKQTVYVNVHNEQYVGILVFIFLSYIYFYDKLKCCCFLSAVSFFAPFCQNTLNTSS